MSTYRYFALPAWILLSALLVSPATALSAEPADVPAPADGSLDDQLLGDLEAELLDDLKSDAEAAQPKKAESAAQPTADQPATTDGKDSLDEQLLRGLGGDLLEGLDEPPGQSGAGDPADQQPGGEQMEGQRRNAPLDGLDEELLRGLGGDLGEDVGDEGDPLVSLSRQMRQVEDRIQGSKSDEATQEMQQQIVRDLAKLIEQVKKQQQQQQSSSSSQQQTAEREQVQQPRSGQPGQQQPSGQQNQAARDSSEQLTSQGAERPDPAQLEALIKNVWGELPERLRQQMMQSSMEDFLPKYELLIEEYFRTLSERQQEP